MTALLINVTALPTLIIRIEYADECLSTLDDARVLIRKVCDEGNYRPFGIIHISGRQTTVEKGVREYFSERSKTGDDAEKWLMMYCPKLNPVSRLCFLSLATECIPKNSQ